jgi:predicted MFS family arabinose efflux permease
VAVFLYGHGLSLRGAASVVALAGGFAIAGTVGVGILADRIRGEFLLALLIGIQLASCLVFVAGAPVEVVVPAVLFFGMTTGGFIPVYTMIVARRFGPESIGRAMGLINLFMLPVSAASGPAAAAVFDATGSYAAALFAFVGIFVLALLGLRRASKLAD